MALPFRRSLRSLSRDSHRRTVLFGASAVLLIAAWAAWAMLSRVTLYESSRTARLESVEPVHRLQAPIDGRVVEVLVELGDDVREGQPVLRLASEAQQLELSEARARTRALEAQIEPLELELEAANRRLGVAAAGSRDAVSEAEARRRAARAQADLAEDHASRVEQLAPNGAASDQQREQARAEATRAQSEAEAARHAIDRLRYEHLVADADVRVRTQGIRRELARLRGEIETARAYVERLERELDRRAIVAPVGGRVADIDDLAPGRYVAAGTDLMRILPRGRLRIVATFEPGQAFGRVRAGQAARMRLDGFPWTRFGMLEGEVLRVADEAGSDGVRIELELADVESFPAPLEHGLPGRVEVAVEEISPAELLVRTAGQWTS